MADLVAPDDTPLGPEAEWLMHKVVAVKGKGKKKEQWVQHGIGRTEEEARRSVQVPAGYAVVGTPEVVARDVVPEHYEMFRELPMFEAAREERRKAAKRG